jgi:hypothetical protein
MLNLRYLLPAVALLASSPSVAFNFEWGDIEAVPTLR